MSIQRTELDFWVPADNGRAAFKLKFTGPCIASLKTYELPFNPVHIDMHWKEHISRSEISAELENKYLKFLNTYGFVHTMTQVWNFDGGCSDVWRTTTPMNMMSWFSHLVVLRYLYECPRVILWWNEKCEKYPQYDPWVIFVLAHTNYGRGHSLMSVGFTKVVNPRRVLQDLKLDVGPWDNKKFTSLFNLWGGNDTNLYYTRHVDTNFEKCYEKALETYEV